MDRTTDDKKAVIIKKSDQDSFRCVLCKDCKNFDHDDNYCKLLQINWLPDEFGCTKGEKK